MGLRLVALLTVDPELELVAALEMDRHPHIGEDTGILAGVGPNEISLTAEIETDIDVMIDFSVPEAAERIVLASVEHGIPLVTATTGLDESQQERVAQAAQQIPVVSAPNMSLAVNLTMKLTEIAARALREHDIGTDVEIIERHHRYKEDAPSGTALRFGEIVADGMGQTHHVHGRHGRPGVRSQDEIGYHALRVGDNPGEHTIVFGMLGEKVELTVGATSRDCYAMGAISAAKFVIQQPPGMYGMNDVLGL